MSDFSKARFTTTEWSSNSKYAPTDWHRNNATVLYDAQVNFNKSQFNRVETDHEDRCQRSRLAKEQESSRRTLVNRVHNINNYMRRLENEIELARRELAAQTKNRERITKALDATEVPMQTVIENLKARNRRIDTDQVADNAEIQMMDEKDHYIAKQKTLQDIKEKAVALEAELNHRIDLLQADWSDKFIANQADTHAGNLHNQSALIDGADDPTGVQAEKSVLKWEQRCEDNIRDSGSTRQESAKHREFSSQVICKHVNDSRRINDAVNRAVQHRIYETINQRQALTVKLNNVVSEFNCQEKNAVRINTALKDQIPHVQVNLTRRRHRNVERPENRENLHDQPENQLMHERVEINEARKTMLTRMDCTQDILSKLQATIDHLNEEVEIKTKTLNIDQKEIVPMRASFPSESTLMGY